MIKTETTIVTVEQTEIVHQETICNRCGRVAVDIEDGNKLHDPKDGSFFSGEFLHILYTGGYHNWVVGDMNNVEFHLCQFCVGELIDTFKIPPIVENGYAPMSWEKSKENRPEWRC